MEVLGLIYGVFIGILVIANCNALREALYSQDDVCRLFPDGVVLRRAGSCQETIKCHNGQSMPHSVTCTDNEIVKLDKMTCAKNSKKSPDKYCIPTCTKNSPQFIEDLKNCHEWSECYGGEVVQSNRCPYGQIFDQDGQYCIYDNGQCNRTYDICNVAKTNQRFWDENNCHKYFYCNAKQQLVSEKCPISTYYDASTGQCIKKTQVDCIKHPMPEEACGSKKLAILNRFISDKATCRGYYYCKDLGKDKTGNFIPDESPKYGQCRAGEFFDAEIQACHYMNNVKCEEDRCDGRHNDFILSERRGCQHYLVCENGHTTDEVKCGDNKYFNPVTETCVDTPISYPICN